MEILDYVILLLFISVCSAVAVKIFSILYTSWSLLPSRFISGSSVPVLKSLTQFNWPKSNRIEISNTFLKNESDDEFGILSHEVISFKVFCASERSLSQVFNLIPWESRGILKFDGSDIHFNGMRYRPKFLSLNKTAVRVKYKFPRNQVKISYLPSRFMRDGGLSWLKMEVHNRKFYFTSGHQSRLPNSSLVSTQDIYEIVTDF